MIEYKGLAPLLEINTYSTFLACRFRTSNPEMISFDYDTGKVLCKVSQYGVPYMEHSAPINRSITISYWVDDSAIPPMYIIFNDGILRRLKGLSPIEYRMIFENPHIMEKMDTLEQALGYLRLCA